MSSYANLVYDGKSSSFVLTDPQLVDDCDGSLTFDIKIVNPQTLVTTFGPDPSDVRKVSYIVFFKFIQIKMESLQFHPENRQIFLKELCEHIHTCFPHLQPIPKELRFRLSRNVTMEFHESQN